MSWTGVVSEECVHGHHHSGGAEPTLQSVVLHQITLLVQIKKKKTETLGYQKILTRGLLKFVHI